MIQTTILRVSFVVLIAIQCSFQFCHNTVPDPFPVRDYGSNRINSRFWNDFLTYINRVETGNDNRVKTYRKEDHASQIVKPNMTTNSTEPFHYSDPFRASTPASVPQCQCVCGSVFQARDISLADLKAMLTKIDATKQQEMAKEQKEVTSSSQPSVTITSTTRPEVAKIIQRRVQQASSEPLPVMESTTSSVVPSKSETVQLTTTPPPSPANIPV